MTDAAPQQRRGYDNGSDDNHDGDSASAVASTSKLPVDRENTARGRSSNASGAGKWLKSAVVSVGEEIKKTAKKGKERASSRSRSRSRSKSPVGTSVITAPTGVRLKDLEHGGGASGGETTQIRIGLPGLGSRKLFSLEGHAKWSSFRDKAAGKLSKLRHGDGNNTTSTLAVPAMPARLKFCTAEPPSSDQLTRGSVDRLDAIVAAVRSGAFADVDAHARRLSPRSAPIATVAALAAALIDGLPAVSIHGWVSPPTDANDSGSAAAPARTGFDFVDAEHQDIAKTRAIFVWITTYISYDASALFQGTQTEAIAASDVLRARRTVCEGYANLFYAICHLCGIACFKIGGRAAASRFELDLGGHADLGHAWNAVCLGSEWFLVDCTWGAGYVNRDETFVQDTDNFYFCALPENLIHSHYPDFAQWQLLSNPVSAEDFDMLVPVKSLFFKRGLCLASHRKATISVVDQGDLQRDDLELGTLPGHVIIDLFAPVEVGFLTSLKRVDSQMIDCPQKLEDGFVFVSKTCEFSAGHEMQSKPPSLKTSFSIQFPATGLYIFEIFTKVKSSELGGDKTSSGGLRRQDSLPGRETYQKTLEYVCDLSRADEASLPPLPPYPKAYPSFSNKGHSLVSPTSRVVYAGETASVAIGGGTAIDIQAMTTSGGKKWTKLNRNDDGLFVGSVPVPVGAAGSELRILAAYPTSRPGSFTDILHYSIE